LEEELPLTGGRVTPGLVRLGNTVRRPPAANSDLVRRFLEYLASNGFEGAPAFLEVDEQGRDMLSFIDGVVPADLGFHADATLHGAASLIRRFHDLGAALLASAGGDADVLVVCHNDLSPCNFVFRAGTPVAIIDFDAAAPGTRADDLGYAAWLWLDIGSPDISAGEQRRRLMVFLDAYGTDEVHSVLAAMLERQRRLADEGRRLGRAAMAGWAEACLDWTGRHLDLPGRR
jgi:hypothetical protein